MTMKKATLGIIGGSGLYDIEGLTNKKLKKIDTPFGKPSGSYLEGILHGTPVVFLPRHGIKHTLLPSEINYRANIHGFRQLGVRHLLSVSAVGSLKEAIHPGDLVLPTQFFDRTKGRPNTFFGNGVVAHVGFGDPVCSVMVDMIAAILKQIDVPFHRGGTYVCMEGPMFSTRSESLFYRSLGADVIGMTNLPEAKLAREAEMCYASLALATDYDCWHASEESVSAGAVLEVMRRNIANTRKVIQHLAKDFPPSQPCSCQRALEGALVTKAQHIPARTKQRLKLLAGRFF
jgi:5'-methylthioadenosine phosphorylase